MHDVCIQYKIQFKTVCNTKVKINQNRSIVSNDFGQVRCSHCAIFNKHNNFFRFFCFCSEHIHLAHHTFMQSIVQCMFGDSEKTIKIQTLNFKE